MLARRSLIGLACSLGVLLAALLGAGPTAAEPHSATPAYVPSELLVRFKAGVAANERREVLATQDVASRKSLRAHRLELLRLEPGASVAEAAAELERDPAVLHAEPNALYEVQAMPNDPRFNEMWGLHADPDDDDIDMPEAWDLNTGSAAVTVAVVDTGIRYTHADLAPNIWLNAAETVNGIDDDGNGRVDDVRGWDFFENDNDPDDWYGHGTHVAGTIGAAGNNGVGVTGINWQVKLMPLRAGEDYSLPLSAIVDAFDYACAKSAKVLNGSFGGPNSSSLMLEAIADCPGMLFVFAAGNGGPDQVGDDNDAYPTYPCNYTSPNIVCVAATDRSDVLTSFSNYGVQSVDLAAPGAAILSAEPGGGYAFQWGTSMAAPHVAGVAALLRDEFPNASVAALKNALIANVDQKAALSGRVLSGGRLNAFRALQSGAPEPPPPPAPPPPVVPPPPPPALDNNPPSDPAVISTSHTSGVASTLKSIVVNWSGANDFGSGVDGFSYHWDAAPTTAPDLLKDAEEATTTTTSPQLAPGSYYFHLRTRDNAGNWSGGVHLGPFVIVAPAPPAPAVRCVVPRVIGRTLLVAKHALGRARCGLGRVTKRRSRVRRGRVIAQSRRAGTRLAGGSRINLTLSRGRR